MLCFQAIPKYFLQTASLVAIMICTCFVRQVHAEEPTAAGIEFFEAKIRPVLIKHCYECHSTDAKSLQANLFLDSREGKVESLRIMRQVKL